MERKKYVYINGKFCIVSVLSGIGPDVKKRDTPKGQVEIFHRSMLESLDIIYGTSSLASVTQDTANIWPLCILNSLCMLDLKRSIYVIRSFLSSSLL